MDYIGFHRSFPWTISKETCCKIEFLVVILGFTDWSRLKLALKIRLEKLRCSSSFKSVVRQLFCYLFVWRIVVMQTGLESFDRRINKPSWTSRAGLLLSNRLRLWECERLFPPLLAALHSLHRSVDSPHPAACSLPISIPPFWSTYEQTFTHSYAARTWNKNKTSILNHLKNLQCSQWSNRAFTNHMRANDREW